MLFDYRFSYSQDIPPGILVATGIVGAILAVLGIIATWKIFKKADEPGWASIVPFYNSYVLFKITWGSGWKFLLMLIPIVNVVIAVMTAFKLARSFGKGTGFGFGLLFLSFIFMLILGFGDAEYQGPA